jgi:AraC-like DNA-binding protein
MRGRFPTVVPIRRVTEISALRASGSVREFLADPIGAYITGRSFAVWAQTPARVGSILLGPIERSDHAALTELFALARSPALADSYDALHDLGAAETLDRASFELVEQFLSTPALRPRRFAVVRPQGLAGAAFAGLFHDRVRPHTDGALFATRDEALVWLGVPADDPARVQLDTMIDSIAQIPPELRRLRSVLAADLREATLERAAAALSTSTRTLQRYLASQDTTFRDELTRVRVAAAESLLVTDDLPIKEIAIALGFESIAAFTSMFTRAVGESPLEYRRLRSAAPIRTRSA